MRSLCTCAALAVATAFAHGHFADALLRSSGIQRSNGVIATKELDATVDDCLEKINGFRDSLVTGATPYVEDEEVKGSLSVKSAEDLEKFLGDKDCGVLESGEFAHMSTNREGTKNIFVITAKKESADSVRQPNSCEPALTQWKSGFSAFDGKHPPVYKDYSLEKTNANPYAKPNAAALASLLQEGEQTMVCGTLQDCEKVAVLCYFKPSNISTEAVPVDPKLWHALEAEQKLKPKLGKEDAEENSLESVNAARGAVGLSAFNPVKLKKTRKVRSSDESGENKLEKAVQSVLYTLTCDDILSSKISPAPSDEDFTVIYFIKDGAKAPTVAEAVKHWESGFEKLKYKRPPVFKKDVPQANTDAEAGDAALEASEIYNDSAVAGYVSIMTDDPRTMACFVATGCEVPESKLSRAESQTSSKSGLICVVHTATLKEGEQPISKKTWNKIMENKGYSMPEFSQLEASKNCLEEMNAVRTQEKLGLKPFLVKAAAAKSDTKLVLSDVMESVTCQAIGGAAAKTTNSAGPEFKITDGTTSLMYHTGTENTCSEAVEAWKKGQEKFSAAPPAYTAAEELYKDAAATNFVSLISDGESTTATCYLTGCTKGGIVCELSPAALVEGKKPVSNETWTKYTEKNTETSGVAGVSKAALIGTVVMTLAAGVFIL